MAAHSTARALTVEDELVVPEAEAAQRHQLVLIESMLRSGHDEDEIVAALSGEPIREYQPAVPALFGWIRTKVARRQAQS
jgi:hypothetical protein